MEVIEVQVVDYLNPVGERVSRWLYALWFLHIYRRILKREKHVTRKEAEHAQKRIKSALTTHDHLYVENKLVGRF